MENHKIKYLACSNEITFNKKENIEATLLSDKNCSNELQMISKWNFRRGCLDLLKKNMLSEALPLSRVEQSTTLIKEQLIHSFSMSYDWLE